MKKILCLLLCIFNLFTINVHATNSSELDILIYQDESTNNLIITSSSLEYINSIESIDMYDGDIITTIEIEKEFNDNFNATINEKSKSLIIYFSTLNNINTGSYKITIHAKDYDDIQPDEYGTTLNKNIIDAPGDVLVTKHEDYLEIKSKDYSFIHGLVLDYNDTFGSITYSYIQFSKTDTFDESITYENAYADLPFSDIIENDGWYILTISNERLKSMGFEPNIKYYVQIQSACYKAKNYGSHLLVEQDEKPVVDNNSDEIIDENKDDKVEDTNKPIEDDQNDGFLDKVLMGLGMLSIALIGVLFLLVSKNYKRK